MKKLVTLLLAAAMLLTVCAMASAEKITVAYHPHITGVGGLLNAIDNGYFDEEGLEVELVQFTSGATERRQWLPAKSTLVISAWARMCLRRRASALSLRWIPRI